MSRQPGFRHTVCYVGEFCSCCGTTTVKRQPMVWFRGGGGGGGLPKPYSEVSVSQFKTT
ncbi:hypothetical protein Hanom_Chr02g00146761 [Helianthus anomalus]